MSYFCSGTDDHAGRSRALGARVQLTLVSYVEGRISVHAPSMGSLDDPHSQLCGVRSAVLKEEVPEVISPQGLKMVAGGGIFPQWTPAGVNPAGLLAGGYEPSLKPDQRITPYTKGQFRQRLSRDCPVWWFVIYDLVLASSVRKLLESTPTAKSDLEAGQRDAIDLLTMV